MVIAYVRIPKDSGVQEAFDAVAGKSPAVIGGDSEFRELTYFDVTDEVKAKITSTARDYGIEDFSFG